MLVEYPNIIINNNSYWFDVFPCELFFYILALAKINVSPSLLVFFFFFFSLFHFFFFYNKNNETVIQIKIVLYTRIYNKNRSKKLLTMTMVQLFCLFV